MPLPLIYTAFSPNITVNSPSVRSYAEAIDKFIYYLGTKKELLIIAPQQASVERLGVKISHIITPRVHAGTRGGSSLQIIEYVMISWWY